MGTKLNPGRFDCYAAALPDEPMFVLNARDPDMPEVIRYWITLRQARIGRGEKPTEDLEVVQEAAQCATDAAAWREENKLVTIEIGPLRTCGDEMVEPFIGPRWHHETPPAQPEAARIAMLSGQVDRLEREVVELTRLNAEEQQARLDAESEARMARGDLDRYVRQQAARASGLHELLDRTAPGGDLEGGTVGAVKEWTGNLRDEEFIAILVGDARRLAEARLPRINVGPETMKRVFRPRGLTNLSDMQAMFDAVESALLDLNGPSLLRPRSPTFKVKGFALTKETLQRGADKLHELMHPLVGKGKKASFVDWPIILESVLDAIAGTNAVARAAEPDPDAWLDLPQIAPDDLLSVDLTDDTDENIEWPIIFTWLDKDTLLLDISKLITRHSDTARNKIKEALRCHPVANLAEMISRPDLWPAFYSDIRTIERWLTNESFEPRFDCADGRGLEP